MQASLCTLQSIRKPASTDCLPTMAGGFRTWIIRVTALLLTACACQEAVSQTLSVLPENPRYFSWRGRPLVIVGSAEHYGAVLNADFDYRKYLTTLGQDRLNHTRLFTGAAYVEPQGAFNIAKNTLAPDGTRYLTPWARSDQPGYAGGGHRFDLSRWDESYFERLRDFVREAGRQKVIVEVNLFCPFYEESQWTLSPFHPGNNTQGAGQGISRTNVYTLDHHGGLLAIQERFVDRVVAELQSFDNLYYEICNEPYFGGVTLAWQAHIAQRIANAQASHADPKLISQNIANNQAKVDAPLRHVSIYNFHYAAPPHAVAMNAHLRLPLGDNETGFRGTQDAPYRMEAWDFLIAGGALFSHLDYSFTVGHEDGLFAYPSTQPGGGNPVLRRQFRLLREFVEDFDLTRVKPDDSVLVGGIPSTHTARALVEPGKRIGVYFRPAPATPSPIPASDTPRALQVRVSAGQWDATWIDPVTGGVVRKESQRVTDGNLSLQLPTLEQDLALSLVRR